MSDDYGVLQIDSPEVIVITVGEQGLPGRDGVDGIAGGVYLEFFFAAALQVLINHNFGRRPAVQILSPGSLLVGADVAHASVNQVRLNFTSPQAGLAILTA